MGLGLGARPTRGVGGGSVLVLGLGLDLGAGEMSDDIVQREVERLDAPLEPDVLLVLARVHDDVRHLGRGRGRVEG